MLSASLYIFCLYLQISDVFCVNQRSFFMRQVVGNVESQNLSEGWGQTSIECSALNGTSVAYAPGFRELLRRRGREHARAGRQRGAMKHCPLDMALTSTPQQHWLSIGPTEDGACQHSVIGRQGPS